MEHTIRYHQARRITLIGVGINILLAVIKIVYGIFGQSHALFADGIHSASDLLTDILVLFAAKYGSRAADIDHPYGHRRIETAATVLLAFVLTSAGLFIIADAGLYLFAGDTTVPHTIVLWIALISMVSKEILYRATVKIAKKIKSKLLHANAWHHRSDAASSLVVLLGILGALLGYPYLDSIAALIVGGMVIKMGIALGWSGVRELVDTGLDEPIVDKIRFLITQTPGVKALHQLRSRTMGHAIFVDVHIQVDPYLSVSEGHFIGQQVHAKLTKEISEISDVTVHVDPEDDEIASRSFNLPNREKFLATLQACIKGLPGSKEISHVTLHYLNGKIHLEMSLPIIYSELVNSYQEKLATLKDIGNVRLTFII